MAFVIAAPSSGAGKTLLSLILSSWVSYKGKTIQTFKVGPDYLDPQQLSLVSKRPCRNLDLILSGRNWVEDSFYGFSNSAEFTLIEGVMGLFDGLGSSRKGSTADIARLLDLPVVLIVDAKGQAASLASLVKGFRDEDKHLKIAGVVLNNVSTLRHQKLLVEVLRNINIKVLGSLPKNKDFTLPSRYLGLIPPHEVKGVISKVPVWASMAENCLDMESLAKMLKAPKSSRNTPIDEITSKTRIRVGAKVFPIAVAEDKAFHFRYPETKECLEKLGMPLIPWEIVKDQEIPQEAMGLILPGGFPEQYAEEISQAKKSLNSIKKFFCQRPIYAECGGMLILGQTLSNPQGKEYEMARLLPFHAKKGQLTVGYRKIKATSDSPIIKTGQELYGHEFHRWELTVDKNNITSSHPNILNKSNIISPWNIKGWDMSFAEEGWSNNFFHASWMHLHWPSSPNILKLWNQAIKAS